MLLLLYWVQLFYMACELELGCSPPCIICQAVIVNALVRKRNVAFLEKSLPANALGPLTDTFIFLSIFSINFKDILDCRDSFRPTWRSVGQKRNNELGELWRGPGVGDLAANQDGNTVTFRICQRPGNCQSFRTCPNYRSCRSFLICRDLHATGRRIARAVERSRVMHSQPRRAL